MVQQALINDRLKKPRPCSRPNLNIICALRPRPKYWGRFRNIETWNSRSRSGSSQMVTPAAPIQKIRSISFLNGLPNAFMKIDQRKFRKAFAAVSWPWQSNHQTGRFSCAETSLADELPITANPKQSALSVPVQAESRDTHTSGPRRARSSSRTGCAGISRCHRGNRRSRTFGRYSRPSLCIFFATKGRGTGANSPHRRSAKQHRLRIG